MCAAPLQPATRPLSLSRPKQGSIPLAGIEFKQTAYALDRNSRKAALARFLKRASVCEQEEVEDDRRLAA